MIRDIITLHNRFYLSRGHRIVTCIVNACPTRFELVRKTYLQPPEEAEDRISFRTGTAETRESIQKRQWESVPNP